jgi:hypothetical protein
MLKMNAARQTQVLERGLVAWERARTETDPALTLQGDTLFLGETALAVLDPIPGMGIALNQTRYQAQGPLARAQAVLRHEYRRDSMASFDGIQPGHASQLALRHAACDLGGWV